MSSTASSTVSTAPTGAATVRPGCPSSSSRSPVCSASGRQASTRSPTAASTSTSTSGAVRSVRASASRPSSSSESRSASSSAAPWSSTAAPSTCPCRFDRRSRSAVSGLRSWWLASATNARCAASAPVTVSAMRSNDTESRRSSGGPLSSATGSAAPPARTADATRPVPSSSRRTGCRIQRTTGRDTSTPSASAEQHRARDQRPRLQLALVQRRGGRDRDDGAAHLAVDQHRLRDHQRPRRPTASAASATASGARRARRRAARCPSRRAEPGRCRADGANGVPSAVTTCTDTP